MEREVDIDKIKLVTLDGDGTLYSYEHISGKFHSSWDALGSAYGLTQRWDARTKEFYVREKEDFEWVKQDVADLAGRKIRVAEKVLYPVPYIFGVQEFARRSKGKMIRGILSAGINLVIDKIVEELGLEFGYSNLLHRQDGHFAGTHEHRVPLWKKHEKIPEICERYRLNPEEIFHIGDGENDLKTAQMVGGFGVINPKTEEVKKAADVVFKDFFEVINYFGLSLGGEREWKF